MTSSTPPSTQFDDCSVFHAEVLATLHVACFVTAWSVKEFKELLVLPTVFGFLAHTGNKVPSQTPGQTPEITGFILCQAVAKECEVLTLGILPEWRRQGIADKMLEAVSRKAEEKGALKMFLEVAENNVPAYGLYATNGFEEVGRRSKYYQTLTGPIDALILTKHIN